MTRLLAVLGQGDRLPSGHIRGLIYREQLAASGIAAQFVFHLARPILPKLPWLGHRLRGLLTRINERRILRLARGADVIYLQKVIALHLLRALRRETRARIVLDVCDALWLMEDVDAAELDEVLRGVDAVTTDNEVTAAYVRRFNAQCTVVPDPSQVEAFDRRRVELARKPADRIVLGWLGSPTPSSTCSKSARRWKSCSGAMPTCTCAWSAPAATRGSFLLSKACAIPASRPTTASR